MHDAEALAAARESLAGRTPVEMQDLVLAAVEQNAAWRGRQCLNLVAAEAPTSPAARALLASDLRRAWCRRGTPHVSDAPSPSHKGDG
jgi:glycine hydroxymethyltransferase